METDGTVISGRHVRLRPLTEADTDWLAELLTTPQVARWWPGFDRARVHRELVADPDGTVCYAVEHGGRPVGLVQYAEETDPDYRHAGIDVALHPGVHGRGLGADTVHALARYLFEERGHHRLVIDPAAANERAVRCYRRVGFRPVGVMRRYERAGDGTWRDGLLMDLLRDELPPAPTSAEPSPQSG